MKTINARKTLRVILISLILISICLFVKDSYLQNRIDEKIALFKINDAKKISIKLNLESALERIIRPNNIAYAKEPKVDDQYFKQYAEKQKRLNEFKEINDSVKCILTIPNTNIEYPVLQSNDNEFYLRRNINCEYDINGSIYFDYECDITDSANLIVYGHNMRSTRMFSDLIQYKKEEFFKAHEKILLYTTKGIREYKAVGYAVIDLKNKDNFFPFNTFINAGQNMDSLKYVNSLKRLGKMYNIEEINPESNLLTLATCDYELEDARLVLIAVEVDRLTH
ncbi:MAG: class B sortase [Tissierellia bacterium]|nr:class B sortase [Tissierellia bacterium]